MDFIPIGSSDYDLESTDISVIVNYQNNRGDPLSLHAITSLYSARILSFIDGIRKTFDRGFESLKENPYFSELYKYVLPYTESTLRNNFNILSDNFEKVYDEAMRMHNQFILMEGGTIDRKLLFKIFELLSRSACLSETEYFVELLNGGIENDDLFPFLSNTGHFGLNSFLYAYFNGVFLVGFPITFSTYDKMYGCSYKFAKHDIDHYYGLNATKNAFDRELLKRYYYSIVSSSMEKWEKELCLFILFMCIHEYGGYTQDIVVNIEKIIKNQGYNVFKDYIDQSYDVVRPYSQELAQWLSHRISNDKYTNIILHPAKLEHKYAVIFIYFEMIVSRF